MNQELNFLKKSGIIKRNVNFSRIKDQRNQVQTPSKLKSTLNDFFQDYNMANWPQQKVTRSDTKQTNRSLSPLEDNNQQYQLPMTSSIYFNLGNQVHNETQLPLNQSNSSNISTKYRNNILYSIIHSGDIQSEKSKKDYKIPNYLKNLTKTPQLKNISPSPKRIVSVKTKELILQQQDSSKIHNTSIQTRKIITINKQESSINKLVKVIQIPTSPALQISQLNCTQKLITNIVNITQNFVNSGHGRVQHKIKYNNTRSKVREGFNYNLRAHNLKRVYMKQQQLLQRNTQYPQNQDISKMIIIHFEGVIQRQTKTFWGNRSFSKEVTPCSGFVLDKSQCDDFLCPCSLKSNLKLTLKMCAQHKFYVVIVFASCFQITTKWHNYLLDNQYLYDSIYHINTTEKQNAERQLQPPGINYSKIITDSKRQFYNILIFNSLSSEVINLNFDSLEIQEILTSQAHYFQQKIPLISKSKIPINLVYLQSSNDDTAILFELAYSLQQNDSILVLNSNTYLTRMNVEQALDYFTEDDKKYKEQKLFHQLIQKIKKIYSQKSQEQIKPKETHWITRSEIFRDKVIDHIKMMLTVKYFNLHFMIGDLIARNQTYFMNQAQDQFYQNNTGQFTTHLNDLKDQKDFLQKLYHKAKRFCPQDRDIITQNGEKFMNSGDSLYTNILENFTDLQQLHQNNQIFNDINYYICQEPRFNR